MFKRILLMVACLSASSAALAGGLKLGIPQYGGQGCPAGTASLTLSPDENELSVLFDQYSVEAGGMTGQRSVRKSCNLVIPVAVPQGFSVAVFSVDYRGYNKIPMGAENQLDAEYFWAGIRGPKIRRIFSGPYDDMLEERDLLRVTSLVWSACGDSLNLRINTALKTTTNSEFEETQATVDSIDVANGLVYHFKWRRCN